MKIRIQLLLANRMRSKVAKKKQIKKLMVVVLTSFLCSEDDVAYLYQGLKNILTLNYSR